MGYRGSKSILFYFILFIFLFIFIYFGDTNNNDITFLAALSPVVSYYNADQEKLDILQDNKFKSGVYKWIHRDSGRSYIGSSVNLTNRFYTYYNLKVMLKSSATSIIARALLKYGYSAFSLEILEYCEPEKCTEREQYYLDLIQPEFNILKNANSRLGSNHSETTIEKIRISLLGNQRAVGGERKLTPIKVIDNLTGIKSEYPSITLAAKALKVPKGSITGYFSKGTESPFKGRYVLTKVTD
jgi:GIY-YIG catalytic domain